MMKKTLKDHNFAEYFNYYISLVDDKDILDVLKENKILVKNLFDILTESKGTYKYGEDKWSIKELLVHIIDTERIFCYRALSFARNEQVDLPGFDHDEYVKNSDANNQTLSNIYNDFEATRNATLHLFKSFNSNMLNAQGTASGNTLTVSAIAYIIVGHTKHHLNILNEKYLSK